MSLYLGLFIGHKKRKTKTSEAKRTHLVGRPRSHIYLFCFIFLYFLFYGNDGFGRMKTWDEDAQVVEDSYQIGLTKL
jgi:hypothetical protein